MIHARLEEDFMQRPRTPCKLSLSLHHQLNLYSLAAGAAGLGIVGLSQPADAKIVYTPAHKQIVPNHTIPLDLNHDGRTDFNIHDSFTCTSFCEYIEGKLSALPARHPNEIVGHQGRSYVYASALAAGVRIGPKSPFSPGNKVMAFGGYDAGTQGTGYCGGPWQNVQHRYLGLEFSIQGEVHFGWARLTDACSSKNGENTALLTGYAYETIPNKPIITGKTKGPDVVTIEPTSLGHLAKGASAIFRWRTAGGNR